MKSIMTTFHPGTEFSFFGCALLYTRAFPKVFTLNKLKRIAKSMTDT